MAEYALVISVITLTVFASIGFLSGAIGGAIDAVAGIL
jgi:Flp pilus assembly pilin Flp